jgi:hypothetical protein
VTEGAERWQNRVVTRSASRTIAAIRCSAVEQREKPAFAGVPDVCLQNLQDFPVFRVLKLRTPSGSHHVTVSG